MWRESKPEILIALRVFLRVSTYIRPHCAYMCNNARLYKTPINSAESVFVIFRPPPTYTGAFVENYIIRFGRFAI